MVPEYPREPIGDIVRYWLLLGIGYCNTGEFPGVLVSMVQGVDPYNRYTPRITPPRTIPSNTLVSRYVGTVSIGVVPGIVSRVI